MSRPPSGLHLRRTGPPSSSPTPAPAPASAAATATAVARPQPRRHRQKRAGALASRCTSAATAPRSWTCGA
eukprot:SM000128S26222  [mRNA]  locus=s128:92159:92462:- [translate_table: standard]